MVTGGELEPPYYNPPAYPISLLGYVLDCNATNIPTGKTALYGSALLEARL